MLVREWVGLDWDTRLIMLVLGLGASLTFILVRLAAGFLLEFVFNADSVFHPLVDGLPGGVLSLGGSLPMVFFLFLCLRWAGTTQELNYVSSLSQPGIESATNQFPPWPRLAGWRDDLEDIILVADMLDAVDPVAGRENRNLAALLTMKQSGFVSRYLAYREDTSALPGAEEVETAFADPLLRRLVAERRRFLLLTDPALDRAVPDRELRREIRRMKLEQICRGIIRAIPRTDRTGELMDSARVAHPAIEGTLRHADPASSEFFQHTTNRLDSCPAVTIS